MSRLEQVAGEWINRAKTFQFQFEGRTYQAYEGDTITSALLANGVKVIGHSFKYHRPRSILSMANHDVNAMMQRQTTRASIPNVRGDITPVLPNDILTATNTFGGLLHDKAAVLDKFSKLLPVGFYYKAFHSRKWFPTWEKMFRHLTGLGKVDFNAPHLPTAKRYDFADVAVIGGGPSGLQAALTAANAGHQVVLIDEQQQLGGMGLFGLTQDATLKQVLLESIEQVKRHPNIRIYSASYVAGYYTDHWLPIVTDKFIVKLRAKALIVATGAYEQPAVFRHNDLPGIMLASAAQRLISSYAVKPFSEVVILAGNDDAYRAAADLQNVGITIKAIVDLRAQASLPNGLSGLEKITHYKGYAIVEALKGQQDSVAAVKIAPIDVNMQWQETKTQTIPCDGVIMSVGWAPALPLLYQAGCKMRFDQQLSQFVPDKLPTGMVACGRANGIYGIASRMADGQRAGKMIVGYLAGQSQAVARLIGSDNAPSHPFPIIAHPKDKNFLDFDEDLQLKDFYNAAQEGFDNIELLKRFSTIGMGPSQGKHANMNAIRVLAKIRNEPIEQVGSTTARPMFHPVPMGHLAGRSFHVERDTPLRAQHDAAQAVWMSAGNWQRPEFYQQSGKSKWACVHDEVNAVRNKVGLIDVGTLGKIDLYGPDAAQFLERVYTGKFANMKPGRTRYGLLLDDSGVLMDDGVIARLADDHFYFTTTTSNSAIVYRELTRLNTMWGLNVGIVNLTGHFAAMNLAGPWSRKVLSTLTDCDLSHAGFPFLAVREASVQGVSARLMRVGFVGEIGYEIHVPYTHGQAIWEALMQAGKPYGIQPFGVEAQRILRLEKGHLIVGMDTDGLTNPYQANMQWALAMDKPFFVGQRSLRVLQKQVLKQVLAGFVLQDGRAGMPKDCHLIIEQGEIAGRITSISHSPSLGKVIGLALIAPQLAKDGQVFQIRLDDGRLVGAVITKPPFYDPQGLREKLEEASLTATNTLEAA
ncbi:2Fe-2S iron-sulfur cluster-binding protein [Ampullimonas aquatilis]|uniref:2Fe-2S iron-sulfur cluster-binding protein n=1 Tax=Ampullimonas aquatilis TaxID=1341549 RepID=UPI003C71C6C9